MRHAKITQALELARALAASAEGLTLDEIAAEAGVGRRTAERLRNAIEAAFGPLDRIEDGRRIRFRMPARGLASYVVAPTSDELAALETAARALERRAPAAASGLRSLDRKIGATLRAADRRRLAVDVEALLRTEALAFDVGPRPLTDPKTLSTLREALIAGRKLSFRYRSADAQRDGETAPRRLTVVPYGVVIARRTYLAGDRFGRGDPVLFRTDRMTDVVVRDEPGVPPLEFDLADFAARSFGVFQEESEEIILRFDAEAADDARAFLFHPTQKFTDETDGGMTVRFVASGLLEIVHHLMTWGPHVDIVSPPRLKALMLEQVAALARHHGGSLDDQR